MPYAYLIVNLSDPLHGCPSWACNTSQGFSLLRAALLMIVLILGGGSIRVDAPRGLLWR